MSELDQQALEAAENRIYDWCYEAGISASTMARAAIEAYLDLIRQHEVQRPAFFVRIGEREILQINEMPADRRQEANEWVARQAALHELKEHLVMPEEYLARIADKVAKAAVAAVQFQGAQGE